MKQKELVLDCLKSMGFEPLDIDGMGYAFMCDDITFFYVLDEDEQFLRIAIPNLFDTKDANRTDILEAMHHSSYLVKNVKLNIMYDTSVWAIYEHYLHSAENLTSLMEHIIVCLGNAANLFFKKLMGEDSSEQIADGEEGLDDNIEEELLKFINEANN